MSKLSIICTIVWLLVVNAEMAAFNYSFNAGEDINSCDTLSQIKKLKAVKNVKIPNKETEVIDPDPNKAADGDYMYVNDDYAIVRENEMTNVSVVNNDYSLLETGSPEIITYPEHGEVEVLEDKTINYTPYDSFVGEDLFTYRLCNEAVACDDGQVDIKVIDVDFIPEAKNDTVTFLHGSEITVNVLKNDVIQGDKPVAISIFSDLTHGYCILNNDNELVPSLERSFIGTDSLDYELCDADGDCVLGRVYFLVTHDKALEFYIPNGFSPNGDGLNDRFCVPDFSTYNNISLQVFNKWGNLVYEHEDYHNEWDGKANAGAVKGQLLSPDTYYYLFKIEEIDRNITGFVYLSR